VSDAALSKYMADCAAIQQHYDAEGVLLVVVGGRLGPDGQPERRTASRGAKQMARMMRFIADDLERRFVLPEDASS